MLEKDFNNIISRSLNDFGGFGFKIPDTFAAGKSYVRSKAPYDGYGIYQNHFVCWESKWLKAPQAFPLTRLEDHQIYNLIHSFELLPSSYSFFFIGVDFGRNDKRCFVWKNEELYNIRDRKLRKENILKKEFEQNQNFVRIHKNKIDLSHVL
jgi:penicillin-binding protein-related factor A (putative recombinase)